MSERQLTLAAQEGRELAPETRQPTIMDIIARASTDPNMDVDKLERLIALSERAQEREARTAYYAALSEMQDKLPVVHERGEIKIGSGPAQKYALWEDINKAIKPILRDHGFALSFRTGISDNMITVTGILSHTGGHAEETTIHLPSDQSGSKNAVQAVGSSTSYGKRYATIALLNLTSTGDDNDGTLAVATIDADQMQHILDQIAATDSNIEDFCTFMGVDAVKHITQVQYGKAIQALNAKARKAKKS